MTTDSKIISVLDHGFVRLVDHMGSDLDIVRAARVSFDADWRTGEDAGKDERLINYLMSHGHTSPFEMVEFKFEVKAPLFVFRQWHRHRTWSYNEVSARYTQLDEGFFVPDPATIGVQSKNNKQARDMTGEVTVNSDMAARMIRHNAERANSMYADLLAMGVPRELARSVLPTCTYSRMFAKVDLNNLFKFLRERLSSGAQYEIRVYAEAVLELIRPIVPVATETFLKTLENTNDA